MFYHHAQRQIIYFAMHLRYILLRCAGNSVFAIYARRHLPVRQTGEYNDKTRNGLPEWNGNVSAGAYC